MELGKISSTLYSWFLWAEIQAWKTLYKNRCLFRSYLTFPIESFATPNIFNWRNYMSLEFRLQKQLPSPNNSTENLKNHDF